jgi:hypothetical protein
MDKQTIPERISVEYVAEQRVKLFTKYKEKTCDAQLLHTKIETCLSKNYSEKIIKSIA